MRQQPSEASSRWNARPAGCRNFGTGLALREEGEGFVAGFKPGAKIKARRPGD